MGLKVGQWKKGLNRKEEGLKAILKQYLGITEENLDKLLD